MNRRERLWPAPVLLASLCVLAGCSHPAKPGGASPSPTPSSKATPFPVAVRVEGMQTTISEPSGKTIAKISADHALVAPLKSSAPGDPIGTLAGATAVLYQDDKPAATLVADQLHADRDTRIVTGTGNVKITSLRQADSPTIRADKMTWRYSDNSIVGEGNVVVTRKPDIRLPGRRFVSDTLLRKFTLYSDDTPATGTF